MARAGLTQERLTRAAAELADDVGFEQVTVSAVARLFDVKAASLYSHLKSSQDLKTRIALLALEEMADLAGEAVAGRAGRDALIAFANAYRDYAEAHPGRYAAARMPLDADTAVASAGPRHTQMMQAILRGYHIAEPEQVHAIRLMGSVFHGYASLEMSGAFSHSSPDPQQSWMRILDALDSLLTNWPAESPA
ncbi:TetR family transcriptional regulator [Rhodococcus hoagii]|nr:TetR family transcriptional regulator [Prescottella equi]NKR28691.1 TetR family transcriptional regulator [Prescottella equi]NKR39673.1 TetR family transcriptional regulator [Prescottella equi]NKR68413.1 TetR family transcriptional regulator [Prescottella equi]NKS23185.1 TetR family transcriptional regulator [Prescottella equi]